MIRKSGKLLGIIVIVVIFLCGCTLANPEQQVSAGTGDQLVGMFVTTEEINKEQQAKVKGELTMNKDNVVEGIDFDGIDGMGCYSVMGGRNNGGLIFFSDEGLSEIENVAGNQCSIKATIYIDPAYKGNFYLNPVYQKPEGQVYLSSVNAEVLIPALDGDGRVFVTIANNSEFRFGNTDDIRVLSIQIGAGKMLSAERMAARQYDASGSLLDSQPVDLGKLSKGDITLKRAKNMAYAVVESDTGKEKRYSITEEDGSVATVYAHNQNNIAVERSIFFN